MKQIVKQSNNSRNARTKTNPALLVPAGEIDLAKLTNSNWKAELSSLLFLHGHVDMHDFNLSVTEETFRHRRRILFSVIEGLVKAKRLKQLGSVRPRYLPWLLEEWNRSGLSLSYQKNNYAHLKWFWKVCSVSVRPFQEQNDLQINVPNSISKDKK